MPTISFRTFLEFLRSLGRQEGADPISKGQKKTSGWFLTGERKPDDGAGNVR